MKTKIYLFIAVIAFLAVSASAQKEMLTKEETVNYLNKKLHEVDGRDLIKSSGTFGYSYLSFQIKGDNLELKYSETVKGGTTCYNSFLFNPGHISAIAAVKGPNVESPVKGLVITFPTKTARSSICPATPVFSDVDKVYFPYFAAVPDNSSRIEKALLHLRDLAKAEEEPFGN